METIKERHRMAESVGMTTGWTVRTDRTYPGTITRTGRPVRLVMSGTIIGTIVGTVSVIRTMIRAAISRVIVSRTMVRAAISAGTVVVTLIAGMLRPVAARTIVVALVARTVVSVAGAVLVAAVLMSIIRGATMRRTRRTLTYSIARMASIGLTAACLGINDGSGEHSHRHYEGCNRVQYLFHNLLLHYSFWSAG